MVLASIEIYKNKYSSMNSDGGPLPFNLPKLENKIKMKNKYFCCEVSNICIFFFCWQKTYSSIRLNIDN